MPGLYIGTSGWNYDEWRDGFYAGVKGAERLAHYARRFEAVEVNATFYRLQKPDTLARWRDTVPGDFRFSIKGNRYLTHTRKLHDPDGPIELERDNARPLASRLSVVLWQLPGNLRKDMSRLRDFCAALGRWNEVRHAVEFRHSSWFDEETAACLDAHAVANCQSDAADWPMWRAVTGGLVYIRLHGHTRTYASRYSTASLKRWASAIAQWRGEGKSVHVYFDNTAEGAAPDDALQLKALLADV